MRRVLTVLCVVSTLTAVAAAADAPTSNAACHGIVFCSDRSGTWALWKVNVDGSGLTQFTKPAEGEQDVDPVFNADGSAIVFTSTRGGKTGVWRVDGSEPQRLCDGDQAEWSPDGTRIALRRDGAVVIRTLKDGQDRTITPQGWNTCSAPAWSPDGATIAFARLQDNANSVYTVPAAGGVPTLVYGKQGACEPHFSPDGKRILYETEAHLCTINPDGKRNRLLTTFGGVQRYGRYSPDGQKVVFCQAAAPQGPWELYIIPAGGGEPVRLTEGGSDMYPDWR